MESSIQTLRFPLINTFTRQFFDKKINDINVRFLYDSGAKIPVWCTGIKKFLKAYPDAKKIDGGCSISGFGKGKERAEVYCIPEFSLVDDDTEYLINNLVIAILTKPYIGCDFLISEAMVSKVDTMTARMGKKELSIICENREYNCTAKRVGVDVKDIAVWMQ